MGKSGLELVIADLVVSGQARAAPAASADKREGHPVPSPEVGHFLANGGNHARQFVARNMGQVDVRVVAHPPVPVAAAQARGPYFDDHPGLFRNRIRQVFNTQWSLEMPRSSRGAC